MRARHVARSRVQGVVEIVQFGLCSSGAEVWDFCALLHVRVYVDENMRLQFPCVHYLDTNVLIR